MIDKSVIEQTLLAKLDGLPVGHCLEIRTYKRNRSVLFIKVSDGVFRIREQGYVSETFEIQRGKLKKTLRTLLKREFPRSRKVRVYDLGVYEPAVHESMDRKKL
jgi:hypothetical protein